MIFETVRGRRKVHKTLQGYASKSMAEPERELPLLSRTKTALAAIDESVLAGKPLSIAQYLPPDHALFDVVIFGEASQIATWDAVGAIARARQTVVGGDPKQLPPTNFFGRNEGEDDVADHEKDLESILDEARSAGIPVRDLRWHYRSRSVSLIAFSNHHYSQNRLVTFPSAAVEDRAMRLHKMPNPISSMNLPIAIRCGG